MPVQHVTTCANPCGTDYWPCIDPTQSRVKHVTIGYNQACTVIEDEAKGAANNAAHEGAKDTTHHSHLDTVLVRALYVWYVGTDTRLLVANS